MDIMEVFDTLIYGKGSFKRGNWSGYVSVKSNVITPYKELKETSYYFQYKGDTVLVIKQEETSKRYVYKYEVIYDGSKKHDHHKNINRTIRRVIDYIFLPHTDYRIIYGK